jgi:hypothetical protein
MSEPEKPRLDLDKIAKRLRGERRGAVTAKGGYFGAIGLAASISASLKAPDGGRRRTKRRPA